MKTINGVKTENGYFFSISIQGFVRTHIAWEKSQFLEWVPLFKKGDLVSLQPGWKGSKNEVEPTHPADLKRFFDAPGRRWVTYEKPIPHKIDGENVLILGHFNANYKHANQMGVKTSALEQGLIVVPEVAKGFIIGPEGATIKMLSRIAGKNIKVLTCSEALELALKEN